MWDFIADAFLIIYSIGAAIYAFQFAVKHYREYKSSHAMISTGPVSEAQGWLTVFGIYFVIGYIIACIPLGILMKICEWIFG